MATGVHHIKKLHLSTDSVLSSECFRSFEI